MEVLKPALKLVTGRCAGTRDDKPCESTELVFDGYCALCAVDYLHGLIESVQEHFNAITREYPDQVVITKKGFVTREPFVSLVKRVANLRSLAKSADFAAIPPEAQKLLAEMSQWEVGRASHLASLHSKSSTEGWQKAIEAKMYLRDSKFAEAASSARAAIKLMAPYEAMRLALVKKMEQKPTVEETSEPKEGSQAS